MTVKTHLFVKASVIDLKTRSMRDNLVFTGIQEDDRENTEKVIQAFLHIKFKLDYEFNMNVFTEMANTRNSVNIPVN